MNKIKDFELRMEELEWCAILQGYGKDLRPLYKHPVIDAVLWLRLYGILAREFK